MDLEPSVESGPFGNSKRPLILAVDDHADSLEVLAQFLDLSGCSWLTAHDGQTALALAHEHPPDLILLDIMLPDMSGFDIIRDLKLAPTTRKIPVVAVTAMAAKQDQERILSSGFDYVITKPYMFEALEEVLEVYGLTALSTGLNPEDVI